MATEPHTLDHMQCRYLKGVGSVFAEKLAKCGLHTVQDLLFYFPLRYQDRTQVTPIGRLRPQQWAVIEGHVSDLRIKRNPRPLLECSIEDSSGQMVLRLFHFTQQQRAHFAVGRSIRCFGEVRWGRGFAEMIHPEYRLADTVLPPRETELTPIYPSTEGFTQARWRMLTDQALALLKKEAVLIDYLPPELIQHYRLPSLHDAVLTLHRPPTDIKFDLLERGQHPAQKRLAFEELLTHHLSLLQVRKSIKTHQAPMFEHQSSLQHDLISNLPYVLTGAQQRVIREINTDLSKSLPMIRLVQGDVGSGKTIVAAAAATCAIEAGYQVALMAPTELLAEQHAANFTTWFSPLGLRVEFLMGGPKGKVKQQTLETIASGDAQIIIGTHAIFQQDVIFQKLGLTIVDEQHRFGVQQRLALREKGSSFEYYPHQLVLTATPIPRTLAMTLYADLDYSVIDELPPNRKPIKTIAVSEGKRAEIISRVQSVCEAGQQVYWVCPLIEESEALQCQAATVAAENLKQQCPNLKIALLHGRMKSKEKEAIMQEFKAGQINMLVATTVIEVGVDVPNATLMVIENAERLGLAQLHQLRGRVGRGQKESYCVLLHKYPLSNDAYQRINAMRETQDGFLIAKKDLDIRGPGEWLGTRQTGLVGLRVADLLRDETMLPAVRDAATHFLQYFPECVAPLMTRWLNGGERYQNV